MKISTNSWHYKVLGWAFKCSVRHDNVGICKYFWMVVASLFWYVILSLGAISAVAVFSGWIPILLWQWYTGVMVSQDFFEFSLAMFTVLSLGAGASLLVVFGKPLLRKRKRKEPPNILFEYVKAKKQKVCPLVEVVDDDYG